MTSFSTKSDSVEKVGIEFAIQVSKSFCAHFYCVQKKLQKLLCALMDDSNKNE